MGYKVPRYIVEAGVDDLSTRFLWDDTKPKEYYHYGSDDVLERLRGVTLRAKLAAAIGIYEWIIGRFYSLSDDPIPAQVAEACWCACIHPLYLRYFELDRRRWLGPVRGPLWCAVTLLTSMIFFLDEEEEPAARVAFLSSLALHVLTRPEPFQTWRDAAVDRLVAFYTAAAADPFENLFQDQPDLGLLLAREVLDPAFNYRPEQARELVSAFLQGVNYQANPYLNSPEEMLGAGFEGTPYRL